MRNWWPTGDTRPASVGGDERNGGGGAGEGVGGITEQVVEPGGHVDKQDTHMETPAQRMGQLLDAA